MQIVSHLFTSQVTGNFERRGCDMKKLDLHLDYFFTSQFFTYELRSRSTVWNSPPKGVQETRHQIVDPPRRDDYRPLW